MDQKTLSIIVPVYNESAYFEEVMDRLLSAPTPGYSKEIIIVDDGSTDGTTEIIRNFSENFDRFSSKSAPGTSADLKVYENDKNRGKGYSIDRGFDKASGEVVVVQDADLECDPHEFPKLLEPIKQGKADVVFGSRFMDQEFQDNPSVINYMGNRFLTFVSNLFTNFNVTDMETCYKMFRKKVLEDITIEENGFGFEPEITAKMSNKEAQIEEVAISYSARTKEEGKKMKWSDGFKALWCIVKYNDFSQ